MNIRLKTFGIFAEYLGREPLSLQLPEASPVSAIYACLDPSWKVYPPAELWDAQRKRFIVPQLFMIDGHDIQDENTILQDGAEILLIPPLEGG